ncbi:hypothetical protein HOU90_gp046 [Lactobacillus phage Lpa804]|uniref:Uncharacterized protein n=1 Tax=Lactobacillus phage Lpa804 TaxID=2059850 RepID=A0A3S6QA82_9CAUD|nr:hypothetical protein HOU90_gp046 [Lactobacillus phage Lpa804]AUG84672.1 hypothetical protein Lpa804_72 [Lactobacillus phage Lpa804]
MVSLYHGKRKKELSMSAETCAYLNTDLTSLLEYLINKYNLVAEDDWEISAEDKNHNPVSIDEEDNRLTYDNSTIYDIMHYSYHGFVSLNKADGGRALFVLECSLDDDCTVKGFKPLWDDDAGCIYVSLAHYGSSVSIIKDLAYEFGGLIDEDDCDDEPYYYVSPALDDAKDN